jgi:subtilisin family serine protease
MASGRANGDHVLAAAKLTLASTLFVIVFCAVFTGPYAHSIVWIPSRSSQGFHAANDWVGNVPGELIIGLGGQPRETLQRLLESWNAKIVIELPEIRAYLVRLEEPDISAKLYEAKAMPYAGLYVEPNYYVHATLTPNDPLWASQWGLLKVRADLAWDTEIGKRSIVVAVVDTGIDYNHEDLAANYIPLGYDWVNHDPDPKDDNGHGTHVCGIIGAVTNNGVGVAGLSQVSIISEKVLDKTGAGTIFNVAQGVIDATNKGARITNNSYGTYLYSDTMRAAFQYASSHGVLNVAAAGNDNRDQPFYPAAFGEFVIAVAGTDQNDARYTSSNYGDWIELSAPAANIISTLPGDSYGTLTGTSMASAFVTGATALVWSHFGTMSADQVRRRLQETAVDLGAAGWDPYFGHGRIDLFSALNQPMAEESVPQTFQICVIQLGVKQLNGSLSWLPGYGWPGLPASQCPEKFEYYNDPVWDPPRIIVFHQFNQTRNPYG